MKKYFFLFLISLLTLSTIAGNSKDNYKIKFKINGIKDTIVYLGHYYGDKKFAVDTANVNSKGEGTFSKNKLLPGGIYFIIMPSMHNTFFEIIIDKDQNFELETDTTNFIKNMKLKGSEENQVFYNYQKFMIEKSAESSKLRTSIRNNKDNADSSKIYKEKLKKVDKEVKDYWANIEKKYPEYLISKIVKSMQEVEIPKPNIDKNNPKKDSLEWAFKYNYYKNHYFDNIGFDDSRMLRTPIFYNKLNTYVTKILLQNPDTLIKAAHKMINEAKADSEMYKYILIYWLNYYEESHLMGMDKLFVDIAENYYLKGKAEWSDSTFLSKLSDRVTKLKPNLVGNIAPDLKLETPDGKYVRLLEINSKYIVIIFWEPHCGHCKKAVPKLFKLFKDDLKAKGVSVYAVYTQNEAEPWTDFIEQKDLNNDKWYNVYDKYNFSNFRNLYDIYSTPTIYLLDKNKKIIAKRLDVDQIQQMIDRLEKTPSKK